MLFGGPDAPHGLGVLDFVGQPGTDFRTVKLAFDTTANAYGSCHDGGRRSNVGGRLL